MMSQVSKRELLAELRPRYRKADRAEPHEQFGMLLGRKHITEKAQNLRQCLCGHLRCSACARAQAGQLDDFFARHRSILSKPPGRIRSRQFMNRYYTKLRKLWSKAGILFSVA